MNVTNTKLIDNWNYVDIRQSSWETQRLTNNSKVLLFLKFLL